MLTSLAVILLAPPALTAPVLPPGCSQDFQRMVVSVEQSLSEGDFASAAKKVQLLPKPVATYSWDDSTVPAASRTVFAEVLESARSAWYRGLAGVFELKPGAPADLKFGFQPKLASAPNSQSPAGLATFVSETTLPRLEAVMGLARGADSRPSNAIDIQDDVEYAIGAYLGVADRPIPTTSMARTDAFTVNPNVVTFAEMYVARRNLEAVAVLRKAIHMQVRLAPAQPKASLSLESKSLTTGPVFQGVTATIPFLITNVGQGDLSYFLIPSCSCISAGPEGVLKPNQTKLVDISIDTTQWSHTLEKKIMVLTNDPELPVQVVPIEVKVNPRYRWIVPGGAARLVGDPGADIDLFLEIPFGSMIYAKDVRFDGVAGKVDIQPWSAEMADPDDGQGVEHREGYHVKLHIDGDIVGGRQVGTVTVVSTSEQFPEIRYNFSFQKGILAMPEELRLGMISSTRRASSIVLSRPQKPFRVLSVDSTSKSLQVKFAKISGTNDYSLEVTPVGKMTSGDYAATIHVYTDDPRQGKINIPVTGTVE